MSLWQASSSSRSVEVETAAHTMSKETEKTDSHENERDETRTPHCYARSSACKSVINGVMRDTAARFFLLADLLRLAL